MYKKFGSVYFGADKDQALGPQARAHEWADSNSSTFFVMFESGLSHDGKNGDINNTDIAQLEKRVFVEFLAARNQYAPEYSNNHRHLRTFLLDFFDNIKSDQEQNGDNLLKYIDTSVYSRSRSIRCLGSSKRKDMSRHFNRAMWHLSSKNTPDSEFYITNIHPNSIRVADNSVAINKSARQATILQPTNALTKVSQVNADGTQVSLPNHIVDAVYKLFMDFEQAAVKKEIIKSEHVGQYKVQYNNNGMEFKLQRSHAGYCAVCMREHTSENGFLRLNKTTGEVFQYCYRSLDKPRISIGKLFFESAISVMTTIASQTPSNVFHADIKYCNETILGKDGKKTIMDDFVAPRREPLQFGNGKFEIIRKHPPSIILKGETNLGKTFFMECIVEANKGCKFITVSCKRIALWVSQTIKTNQQD
ncbi:hypothetical protein BGZ46_002838 [Entomortierella lignicola]|nr:hypothetical protein BGZ46_002838 [Entomortierella lignicola]